MTDDGERLARLEQWTDSHRIECTTRYDAMMKGLDAIRIEARDDRKENRETVARLHGRSDKMFRMIVASGFILMTSVVSLLINEVIA